MQRASVMIKFVRESRLMASMCTIPLSLPRCSFSWHHDLAELKLIIHQLGIGWRRNNQCRYKALDSNKMWAKVIHSRVRSTLPASRSFLYLYSFSLIFIMTLGFRSPTCFLGCSFSFWGLTFFFGGAGPSVKASNSAISRARFYLSSTFIHR